MDLHAFLALPDDALPPEALRAGERALLDTLAVGVSGRATRHARLAQAHARAMFGGAMPLLFAPGTASPAGVALAGGMTIDAVDAHDGWNVAKGHIGCGLIPGLIALAPDGTSGRAFLAALVKGYEVSARLAATLHATADDYHTSGAWIAPGIAAAGGALAGLAASRITHAMGIAEYHGPRSPMMRCIDHPTMLKDGSGWGAMAGVSAVALAAEGFTGAPCATATGPAWADLGRRWCVTEQYVKPYPVCRWAQPPVEAALAVQAAHGIAAADVAAIAIETFHESTRLAGLAPPTTEEAQYSTAFPVAVALARGGFPHSRGAAESSRCCRERLASR
ncbi:MAG: MmgE/PrpD family protein, partial [Shimia sp.]